MWDITLDDAINRMENAKRTCSIYIGVGTAADGQFRVVNYNARNVEVYDPVTQPYGPNIPDVVYRGTMPSESRLRAAHSHTWPQGVDQQCLASQLQKLNGNLTAANAIREIMPLVQTGNLRTISRGCLVLLRLLRRPRRV